MFIPRSFCKYFAILWFGFLLSYTGVAQLHFEKINGLSQNTVYSILKDKQGFLWIATADGLNRYDGSEMKIYKPGFEAVPGKMKGRIIRSAMLEDEDEQIWFATDVTVNCYNKKKQQFLQYALCKTNSVNSNKHQNDAELFANPLLKQGNYLWLASAEEGLFRLNVQTKECINFPVDVKDEDGNKIPLMYNGEFEGNRFWFATKKGLLCFDIIKSKWERLLPTYNFYCIALCDGKLYLGSAGNIFQYNVTSKTLANITKRNEPVSGNSSLIRRLYVDHQKNIWAGDQDGNLYVKVYGSHEFIWKGNINETSASTKYPIYCIYVDSLDNIWTGGVVVGLLKSTSLHKGFKTYPTISQKQEELFVNSIYEDEQQNIWLGTFQNGIKILDKQGKITSLDLSYDPKQPYSRLVPLITTDAKKNLWTSLSGSLYVKENGKKDFISFKFPLPANALQIPQLWTIVDYKDGWLAGTNSGLYHILRSKYGYNIKHLSAFGQTKVVAAWVAPEGKVWIVPETGGILVFADVEKQTRKEKLFENVNVKALQYDSVHDLVWICTSNGLIAYHLASGKHHSYDEKNGLLSSYVYAAVLEDDELWLSTNAGLAKGKLLFEKSKPFPQIMFQSAANDENLRSHEFNVGAYHKGKSGNIYFGSTKGIVWFNPEDIKPVPFTPQLHLLELLANDKPADSLIAPEYISSVTLSYNQNNLFFRFKAVDFNNHGAIRYQYKLEGWDKDWIYSNQLNEIRYNNLPPGDYNFMFSVAGTTDAKYEVKTISVNITPPFWQTIWFRCLVVAILIAITLTAARYIYQYKLRQRIRELEKEKALEEERKRISREMHDDIGAGLTRITLMSELAKHSTPNKEKLEEIANASRHLVSNMSEIIWSLNPEHRSLNQLLAYLREQLNKLLDPSGIDYSIHFPEDVQDVLLSNEEKRNILLVTKEIVHNAVKHGKARSITITAHIKGESLEINITDDGVGFDLSKPASGNELKNLEHRFASLKADFVINTAPGKGVITSFSIPLKSHF